MKVATVIPLAKGIFKDELTYFTAKNVSEGMIVSIPVRKKNIDALVVSVADLAEVKTDVKSSSFNLRKINRIKGPSIFSRDFFNATKEAQRYFLGTHGQVLYSLLPEFIMEEYEKIHKTKQEDKPASGIKKEVRQEKLIFQAPFEDRLTYYKTFIRESFAQKKSVFLCLPTIHELNAFAETLKRGVENYTYVFHSGLPSKEQITRYNKMMREPHPVLIIATGSYLFIPRQIGVYITERESSPGYRSLSRPFLDTRTFLEILSRERGAKLIVADSLLRTETLWRHDQGEFGQVAPVGFRINGVVDPRIINMAEDRLGAPKKFSVLSGEVKEIIRENLLHRKHTFLFTLRKGLATMTTCRDCQTVVLCDKCNTPLILHLKNKTGTEERIFICPTCKTDKNPHMVCRICGSWNLTPMGIGTELVQAELQKEFPDVPIFRLDQECIKTQKQGIALVDEFYKTGGILVGTEMALFYLTEKVENAIIVSFDSLFNLPSFRMHEKIIQLLMILASYSEKKVVIQTRLAESAILQPLVIGNLLQFYRDEVSMREQFHYPPFVTLIKLSYSGKTDDIDNAKQTILDLLSDYKPKIFRPIRAKAGLLTINTALKLPRASWLLPAQKVGGVIDPVLHSKLTSLPPSWTIQVDPEDLI